MAQELVSGISGPDVSGNGQLAFVATYADGSSAVIESVPEPSTLALAAAGGAVALLLRGQRRKKSRGDSGLAEA